MQDDPFLNDIIDIRPPRKRRTWLIVTVIIVVAVFLFGSQFTRIYIDSLWFSSLGYSDVYWYKFRLGGLLFLIFFILTFLIMRLPFLWVNRVLPELTERPRVKITSVQDIREINFLPFFYRPGVWVLSAIVALMAAIGMSSAWDKFALYANAQSGATADPIFGNNISFYLFKLPVLESITSWFTTLAVILFLVIAGVASYVWYLEKLRGTATADTRRRVTTATSAAGALFALALAANTYLNRYDLLYSRHEIFTGMNYTDANIRLVAMNILAALLIISAIALVVNALSLRRARLIFWLAGAVAVVWIIGIAIIPQAVFSFSVKPNELAKESPYIAHNIEMTRHAFAIDRFEERPVQEVTPLTVEKLEANKETLDNVRLWDRRALQATLSQIQEIRTYYEFNVPDVDRYQINGRLRQVFLAAREMNTDQLPDQSKNWINQHLVYTHGYGVTMNTVNEFTPEGLPHLLLKNMPVESEAPNDIRITRPEIYFGEETNLHVYVRTKPQGATPPEFDYPAPDNTESYTVYEGSAGIPVGGFFRQLALSFYLGDGTSLLFSDYITSDSRVLMHRNVRDRVQRIAPYLLFEDDPYIVISRDGKLYWIIDGFTTSERYPYSTEYKIGDRDVNYIRNSVKAVVDAYNGDVKFYVFDDTDDPIIKAYQGIFPSLYRPSSEMPEDLFAHIRYPSLLVNVQANVYTLYHMQNTQTFYNHEDLWAIATAEAPQQQDQQAQPMQPYHVLMQLPISEKPQLEFVSVLPFTPTGPGRSNMIGWLAARSDGANYGKTAVFSFPKRETINGPAQIRARVNQDPELSKLMTLWNTSGSQLLRGGLLVVPIDDSLLYVESFFLQSQGTGSKLPELRQVVLATQDRLATGTRFDEALNKLKADLSQHPTAPAPPITPTTEAQAQPQPAPAPPAQQPAPSTQPLPGNVAQLIQQAQQAFADYNRLMSEGRYREAGEKLEQARQLVNQANQKLGRQ
ncbi:MAG TPA: UPF0182 family protein [Blastocatellia bacterium]|nr:UPF0182 family protein [Blastocatellia bacterium]